MNSQRTAEQHEGREAHAVGDRAGDQRDRDDREGHLVDHEQAFRGSSWRPRCTVSMPMPRRNRRSRLPRTGPSPRRRASSRSAPTASTRAPTARKALRHGGEHVLLAHHAGIEQRQARDGHHQHQRGRGDHPGGVAGVDLRARRRAPARQARRVAMQPSAATHAQVRIVVTDSRWPGRASRGVRSFRRDAGLPGRRCRHRHGSTVRRYRSRRCGCAPPARRRCTKILPSPIWPVLAARRSPRPPCRRGRPATATSTLILGRKFTVYSAPR